MTENVDNPHRSAPVNAAFANDLAAILSRGRAPRASGNTQSQMPRTQTEAGWN